MKITKTEITKYADGTQYLSLEWEVPCTCSCHTNPDEMHIVACCHNGVTLRGYKLGIEGIVESLNRNINLNLSR